MSLFCTIFGVCFYSQTNSIDNYLVLDNPNRQWLVDYFPEKAELSNAGNVNYNYYFDKYSERLEVDLLLSYDEQAYLTKKQEALAEYADKEITEENGELKICVYYYSRDKWESTEKYIFLNDNDMSIRYYMKERFSS